MKMKMKKKILLAVMLLVVVFTGTAVAYADDGSRDDGGITTRDTNVIYFATRRTSATTANVTVDVTFSQVVDRYNVVIYLQKKENGEWVQDSTNPEYVFYNNGGNRKDFTFSHVYTHLKKGVNYRIWCVSRDYIDDTLYITNGYSSQF